MFDRANKLSVNDIQSHAPGCEQIVIKLNGRDYDTIDLAPGNTVDTTFIYVFATGRYQAWFYDGSGTYLSQTVVLDVVVPGSAFPLTVVTNSGDSSKVDITASFKPMKYDTVEAPEERLHVADTERQHNQSR